MRRLYRKIYLTIVLALLAVVAVGAAVQWIGRGPGPFEQGIELASELAGAALPPADASAADQLAALKRLSSRLATDLAIFDAERRPIAFSGRPMPPPPPDSQFGPGLIAGGPGPGWGLRLPDGRWLMMILPPRGPRHPVLAIIFFLGAIAGVVALFAYPVVRGLTGRIERLQRGVEFLGQGNLATRVKVEGNDEVAALAESFNEAAARIEVLLVGHRMRIAHASHELRTPLARIRVGLELLQATGDPKYRDSLKKDLDELDELIEDILVASRLDAPAANEMEELDLLPIVAEECARYGSVDDSLVETRIMGDARFLRHMVRNLLENSRRHGVPPLIVKLSISGGDAVLDVSDCGSGISDPEPGRIFIPFYRVNGKRTGTGLGLSLVMRIARLHGGDAQVIRHADGRFFPQVRIPLAKGAKVG